MPEHLIVNDVDMDGNKIHNARFIPNKTVLNITGTITASSEISCIDDGVNHNVSGYVPVLGDSALIFNESSNIKIERNGISQDNGDQVVWVSSSSISFSKNLYSGDKIIIYT